MLLERRCAAERIESHWTGPRPRLQGYGDGAAHGCEATPPLSWVSISLDAHSGTQYASLANLNAIHS